MTDNMSRKKEILFDEVSLIINQVIELLNGDVVVKRVRFTDQVVILESVNPTYESVIVERKDIEFYHKVTHKKEK